MTTSIEAAGSPASEDERRLRAKAKFRTWFCSGAGLALLGHRQAAWLIYLAAWVLPAALAAFLWFPGQETFWLAVAVVASACVLFVVEQRMISRRPVLGPPQGFLVDQFVTVTLLFFLALGGLVALALGNIGSLRIAENGMAPTTEDGELLAYQKRGARERLSPGAVILHHAPAPAIRERPYELLLSRVLAGPGDEISIQDGRYLVNGADAAAAPPLKKQAAVVVPVAPQKFTVPEKHYYVVQDNAEHGLDSRTLGLVRADDVVSSRLFWLRPRAFFRQVE